jgi:hypothetical protein
MPFPFNRSILALLAAGAVAGCASWGEMSARLAPGFEPGQPPAATAEAGPVALAPQKNEGQPVAMSYDQDALAKAVERLRITKKKAPGSPYDQAGADLNSNGRAKAIVLFTGQDWCSPQGCTLAVFEPGEVGFRPVSQTTGVRGPVAVGPGTNAGWRDLIVVTGSNKIVRLQFTGGGYPSNAAGQPDGSTDVSRAEVLIQAQNPNQTAIVLPASGTVP